MKRTQDFAVRMAIVGLLLCPAIGLSQKVRADHEKVVAALASPTDFYLRHFPPRRPA